mmetsp:Transcript_7793/g.19842  ORF Transcript_7793/g.19842 Transcript_7793/m.19842 type:complete len:223 (+) Transcript_7793:15-683(+)
MKEVSRLRHLALDDGDGAELDGLLGDAGVVARVDHLRDVLVALRRLLHHQLGARHADGDPLGLQVVQHVLVVQLVAAVVAALGPPRAVTRAPERLLHALGRARQDVAARAHGAPDEHGLPRVLVVHRYQRVVRGERARGALAVHQQRLQPPVHHVLLYLGDVVAHVVHHVHVQVVRGAVEHLGERLPAQERHGAAVHPRVVGRARHGRQVVLPLLGVDAGAR